MAGKKSELKRAIDSITAKIDTLLAARQELIDISNAKLRDTKRKTKTHKADAQENQA